MAKISFKAKVQTVYNMDNTVAYRYIQVPELKRSHCDMEAFRQHSQYGSYANSDLFPKMLAGIRAKTFHSSVNGCKVVKLDDVPSGVTVDTSGYLARVTWEV